MLGQPRFKADTVCSKYDFQSDIASQIQSMLSVCLHFLIVQVILCALTACSPYQACVDKTTELHWLGALINW